MLQASLQAWIALTGYIADSNTYWITTGLVLLTFCVCVYTEVLVNFSMRVCWFLLCVLSHVCEHEIVYTFVTILWLSKLL